MSEVQYDEKDIKRLKAMANTVQLRPEAAAEFLNYAYGLGYCHGRTVTAKQFLETIDSHAPTPQKNT